MWGRGAKAIRRVPVMAEGKGQLQVLVEDRRHFGMWKETENAI